MWPAIPWSKSFQAPVRKLSATRCRLVPVANLERHKMLRKSLWERISTRRKACRHTEWDLNLQNERDCLGEVPEYHSSETRQGIFKFRELSNSVKWLLILLLCNIHYINWNSVLQYWNREIVYIPNAVQNSCPMMWKLPVKRCGVSEYLCCQRQALSDVVIHR